MKELLINLPIAQLQAVAFFSIMDVASFTDGQIAIKPLDEWTSTQKLSADILYDDNGEVIGVECRSVKLEALELLAARLVASR